MSLIESKIDVIKLAKDIRSGALPTVQVDLDQFFTKTFGGEWVPDPDTRIQVRETVRDVNEGNFLRKTYDFVAEFFIEE